MIPKILKSAFSRERERERGGGVEVPSKIRQLRNWNLFSVAVFVIVSSFLLVNVAHATTYYVRADGTVTAANKANATSPNAVDTALNMAQVKLATFLAGDQILFSSQGGNYTEILILPSGGSGVNTEITYANVPTETPIIAVTSGYLIDTNSKSNIIIQGLTANYTGLSASTNIGTTIKAGSNIQFKNFTSDMGGFGYNIYSGPTVALSDIVFDNVILTNCRVSTGLCMILSGTSNSNVTIQNLTAANNISISNAVTASITNSTTTGTISVSTGSNISITNIPSTAGMSLSNITTGTISNATSTGAISVATGSNISITDIPSVAGITLSNITTGTISNTTSTGAISVTTGSNISIHDNPSVAGITLSNITTGTISNATSTGAIAVTTGSNISITNIPSTPAITLSGITTGAVSNVVGLNGSGFNFTDSSNITVNDSSMTGSTAYGAFQASGASHDITYNRDTANNNNIHGFVAQDTSYNITYNNCTADNNGNIGFLARESVNNIAYWYDEASYNGTVNDVFDGGGFLPHDSATNVKCYYCIAHHNYNQGLGDVGDGTGNAYYNSTNWDNGYAVGDTFKGSTVTTPSARSNVYYRKAGGAFILNNGIFGGGKPREILNTGPSYTTLNYNLYKPLDDSKFYSTADNISNTSWATYHLTKEPNSNNADPLFVNATGNYTASTDFQLSYLSPAIDTGVAYTGITSTTTDYAGNPIYGTPDIGVYEYQPPFTLGTSLIDPTGNIRIYGDRKYRYTTATSSTMLANFSVAPAEGSWSYTASTTRPEWLTISSITWGATKQWTASSTVATTTIYTIGDLTPNATYALTLDGTAISSITGTTCTNDICTADSEGKITFTYTGGYSTHIFAVTPYTTPTPTPTPAVTSSNSSGGGRAYIPVAPILLATTTTPAIFGCPPNTICTPNPIAITTFIFSRDLSVGSTGLDVKNLQIFLNTHGFIIATIGAGSPGQEIENFGPLTRQALIKFQIANHIAPAVGYFGPLTRALVSSIQVPVVVTPIQIQNLSTPNLSPFISTSTIFFTKNLFLGINDSDVKRVQQFLNSKGYTVTVTGEETTYFGTKTKQALIDFQIANNIIPAIGNFGSITRGVVNGMMK